MASAIEQIETIFVAHISLIEDLKTVLDYEPGTIDRKKLPQLSMFFLLPEGFETATGPTEDVDYRWEVSLYVTLVDWRTAQQEIKSISAQIVENFRHHRTDYGSEDFDLYARALRRRGAPTPADDGGYMRASWELQVTAGEN